MCVDSINFIIVIFKIEVTTIQKKKNRFSQFFSGHDAICQEIKVRNSGCKWTNFQWKYGIKQSSCFDVKCSKKGDSYTVYLKTGYSNGNLDFVCDKEGKQFPESLHNVRSKFSFICKDPSKICEGYTSCPNDCNGRWVLFDLVKF